MYMTILTEKLLYRPPPPFFPPPSSAIFTWISSLVIRMLVRRVFATYLVVHGDPELRLLGPPLEKPFFSPLPLFLNPVPSSGSAPGPGSTGDHRGRLAAHYYSILVEI